MSRNQWHIGVHQRHLMFTGSTWDHMWSQKECVSGTSLGHFMLHFIMFLIRQMTTKASNGLIRHLKQSKTAKQFLSHHFAVADVGWGWTREIPSFRSTSIYIYIAAVQAQYEHSNRATYVQWYEIKFVLQHHHLFPNIWVFYCLYGLFFHANMF